MFEMQTQFEPMVFAGKSPQGQKHSRRSTLSTKLGTCIIELALQVKWGKKALYFTALFTCSQGQMVESEKAPGMSTTCRQQMAIRGIFFKKSPQWKILFYLPFYLIKYFYKEIVTVKLKSLSLH